MKRLIALLIAVGFALGSIVSAQQETAQQPDEANDNDEQAMVRFVHASPNAAVEQVMLMSEEEEAGGVAIADFGDVAYGDMSDYIAVPPGSYEITVVLEAVEGEELARVVPSETLDASEGGYYTVTLMGLVIPEHADVDGEQEAAPAEEDAPAETEPVEAEAPEEAEEAEVADPTGDPFMAWLQGLVAGDAVEEQELHLRLLVLDDEADHTLEEQEMLVRIVHAAPGTDPVALAVMRADDDNDVNDNDNDVNDNDVNDEENDVELVQTVSYGEASGYVSLRAGDTLEIRTEDGEAVILDLTGEGLEPGMLHTVFVTGTPVEPVPIDVVVASTPPAEIEEAEENDEAVAEPEEVNDEAVAVADPERDDVAETEEYAMVRFVHAAPNADVDQVLLVSDDDAAAGLTIDAFDRTDYAEMTDYVAVPAGSYEITVVLAATEHGEAAEEAEAEVAPVVPAETFQASGGEHYTISLMGLMVPERVGEPEEQAEATDEGFIAWLEGLFATENDRGELELRVMVLDDEATTELDEEEVRVRVVHAAPGTEPVSLAVREADADDENGVELVQTVAYGEAGGYVSVTADDHLEVRTEDGEAVILDLADHNLEPGMLHTVFVTGTPVEDMPIEALVASTQPVEHEEAGDEADRSGDLMAAAAN